MKSFSTSRDRSQRKSSFTTTIKIINILLLSTIAGTHLCVSYIRSPNNLRVCKLSPNNSNLLLYHGHSTPLTVRNTCPCSPHAKDCISYMNACSVTHDAVVYVFAHTKYLDFQSVLDEHKTTALCPSLLMRVLYAHTRAQIIFNFCLHPSFNLFNEFFRYYQLYWGLRVADTIQPVQPDDNDTPDIAGHPAGQLRHIFYLNNRHGASTPKQIHFLRDLWNNQDWVEDAIQEQTLYYYPHTITENWSALMEPTPGASTAMASVHAPPIWMTPLQTTTLHNNINTNALFAPQCRMHRNHQYSPTTQSD